MVVNLEILQGEQIFYSRADQARVPCHVPCRRPAAREVWMMACKSQPCKIYVLETYIVKVVSKVVAKILKLFFELTKFHLVYASPDVFR